MFKLTLDELISLWIANHFKLPNNGIIFFGLRGCLPVTSDQAMNFSHSHELVIADPNYQNPRCTIGQVDMDSGEYAIFNGSTVPNVKHVKSSIKKGGKGTNQLMTGYHSGYKKGWHKSNSTSGHRAFRMDNPLPIRRTSDDLDYDELDIVEYMIPYDNIHCGWCMGTDGEFSSAGCQVVTGFPQCQKRGDKPNTGPWEHFHHNAYIRDQVNFDYILLNGRDALAASVKRPPHRIRYGSYGDIVELLQKKLFERSLYIGNLDKNFGELTLFALLDFQEAEFGKSKADGIVGPITATALDINLLPDK